MKLISSPSIVRVRLVFFSTSTPSHQPKTSKRRMIRELRRLSLAEWNGSSACAAGASPTTL